jgi:hypothetical protein
MQDLRKAKRHTEQTAEKRGRMIDGREQSMSDGILPQKEQA